MTESRFFDVLDWAELLKRLAAEAQSAAGRALCLALSLASDAGAAERRMAAVAELAALLRDGEPLPSLAAPEIEAALASAEKGIVLGADERRPVAGNGALGRVWEGEAVTERPTIRRHDRRRRHPPSPVLARHEPTPSSSGGARRRPPRGSTPSRCALKQPQRVSEQSLCGRARIEALGDRVDLRTRNTAEVAGSFTGFTTHLVGIKSDGSYTDLGIGFDWWSNYNGTSGGVTVEKTDALADNNGTGGVTITSIQAITNYQNNGTPTTVDTTPPTLTIEATPAILWPPNGKLVTVTVSGTIQDGAGGSGVNPDSATFFVVDQYGQVQPTGSVTVASDGTYSFTLQLQASRDGNDPNGRQYALTVNASDNAGNSASSTVDVTVPHDRGQ